MPRFADQAQTLAVGPSLLPTSLASTRRSRQTFPLVTLAHIRGHGCPRLLVYCTSPWCNHSATLNADWLPDETALLDLDPRMVCTACGLIGADVRPDWASVTGLAGMGGAHSLS
jgi:hypothetical protein